MAIVFVAQAAAASTTGDQPALTGGINTAGANFCVAGQSDSSAIGQSDVTDNKTNTWAHRTAYTGGGARVRLADAANTALVGSAHTFTSGGATLYAALAAAAFSGVATSPFDQINGATGSSATSAQAGSITPTQTNELIIAVLAFGNPSMTGLSINGGFTFVNTNLLDTAPAVSSQNYGVALAYLIQTSPAAANPTWSWTGSDSWCATIVSYKSADGAAGGGAVIPVFLNHYRQRGN